MNCTIRIPSDVAEEAIADLHRPHQFAAERIGFLHARPATIGAHGCILIAFRYLSVPDHQYVRDRTVGARIDGAAIRSQMEICLAEGVSVLHLHLHEFEGGAGFSPTDREGYPALFRSLRNAAPNAPHGALVLAPDGAYAEVLMPGNDDPVPARKIVIVGRPMKFFAAGGVHG